VTTLDSMHPSRRRTAARLSSAAVLGAVALLALALPAGAHVTVASDDPARGAADAILTFRVPNEEDAASTVKIDIKFPVKNPIAAVKPAAKAGWTVTAKTVPFDPPIKTDDGTITSGTGEVIYTANTPADGIAPGQFASFQILVGPLPDAASLQFPTVQTYSNGKVASWVDPVTDPNHLPAAAAPILTLTAAADTGSTATPAPGSTMGNSASGPGSSMSSSMNMSDGTARGLGTAGLVVGALGLLVGGFGLLRARRSGPTGSDGQVSDPA